MIKWYLAVIAILFVNFNRAQNQNTQQRVILPDNPTEQVVLPTYKDGEVGLAKPAVEKLDNCINNISGRWKYTHTEYENKQKYIVTEVRTHKVIEYKMPEKENSNQNQTPTAAPDAAHNETFVPGSPSDPNKAYFENLNTSDKDIEKIVEMLDPKFQYYFMKKTDSTGGYKVMEIAPATNILTEHTIWDVEYKIYPNKMVPMLSFTNLQNPTKQVSYNIFKLNENEMVIADLKRKVVHYFVRVKQ